MYSDPVIDELRRHGAQIAEECGYDIHRMAERFRREQAEHPERVISAKELARRRGVPPAKPQG